MNVVATRKVWRWTVQCPSWYTITCALLSRARTMSGLTCCPAGPFHWRFVDSSTLHHYPRRSSTLIDRFVRQFSVPDPTPGVASHLPGYVWRTGVFSLGSSVDSRWWHWPPALPIRDCPHWGCRATRGSDHEGLSLPLVLLLYARSTSTSSLSLVLTASPVQEGKYRNRLVRRFMAHARMICCSSITSISAWATLWTNKFWYCETTIAVVLDSTTPIQPMATKPQTPYRTGKGLPVHRRDECLTALHVSKMRPYVY